MSKRDDNYGLKLEENNFFSDLKWGFATLGSLQ